jgi:hypothetical protein
VVGPPGAAGRVTPLIVMPSAPRLLAVMGSGETTPTMSKVHRQLFERLGPPPVPAVLIDTPYGFQSNASDISARAVAYFRESAGRSVEVASLMRPESASPLALEAALARLAEAQWLFSGPGSPTYALRQWRLTVLPQLLVEKLAYGGCVVFSSAAALTLGRWTVPVYEIYKAGADPVWVEGLDLLGPSGLTVAVIPHYDNAEGGTHDTRFCYLGEARLQVMEAQMGPEGWVLGVDEHTVCIFDLDAGTAAVSGLGSVTVRRQGSSVTVPSGTTMDIDDLVALAANGTNGSRLAVGQFGVGAAEEAEGQAQAAGPVPGASVSKSLITEAARLTAAFDDALARRDAGAATEAVLELEAALHAWAADTFQSDELDRARAALRRMVVRLGEVAASGVADPRDAAAPWVTALLVERAEARVSRRFEDADRIRESLEEAGVEVRDTPAGTEWDLRPK